jgi:hypothetical protein
MRDEYDFSGGRRGAVDPLPQGKTRITIRLDNDVLDWFRDQVEAAAGGNYQTLINGVLRDYIARQSADDELHGEQLESTLRRVLREELASYDAA